MAMTAGGGGGGAMGDINVTPMIDILLVLIIIFMVIAPVPPKGLEAAIPQQETSTHTVIRDVVISVAKDGHLRFNQESIDASELGPRLLALGRMGPHNLFVRGDLSLEFQDIVHVIDVARGAGWDRVGLMR